MSERSGLGLVDVAALQAVAALGHPEGPFIRASKVVEAVNAVTGLGPGPSYELLLDHARDWVVPLRLVDFHGNIGTPDFSAAAARYVEARVSRAGLVALDAESKRIAPVPVGLILGDTHRGGAQPPFNRRRLIAAIQQLIHDPNTTDDELVRLAGQPELPTGCYIDGDLDNLMVGKATPATGTHDSDRRAPRPRFGTKPASWSIHARGDSRHHPHQRPTVAEKPSAAPRGCSEPHQNSQGRE